MVVSLILEVYKPLFCLSVDLDRNDDGAGVDLIRNLEIFEFALFAELFHAHDRKVHQANKLVVAAFVDLFMIRKILVISVLNRLFVVAVCECHIFQLCGECRMTAVIGPVCIEHTDLCHRRISLLLVLIVILDVKEILEGHCEI